MNQNHQKSARTEQIGWETITITKVTFFLRNPQGGAPYLLCIRVLVYHLYMNWVVVIHISIADTPLYQY